MVTDRILTFAALLALLVPAGCDRGGEKEAAVAPPLSPEEQAYVKAVDEVNDDRRRLMKEAAAAQESGDPERIAAAAKALVENRRKAAATVAGRSDLTNRNFSSSKEQTK